MSCGQEQVRHLCLSGPGVHGLLLEAASATVQFQIGRSDSTPCDQTFQDRVQLSSDRDRQFQEHRVITENKYDEWRMFLCHTGIKRNAE